MKIQTLGRSLLGIACIASVATGAENNVETELQLSPYVLGVTEQPHPFDLSAKVEMQNELIDRGIVRSDGDTLHAGGTVRGYGFGLKLDSYFAVVPDSNSPRTYFGEFIQFDARLDFLMQLDWRPGIPMLTIDPYLELNTYPDQSSDIRTPGGLVRNVPKNNQQWLGADAWISPPFQGFEGIQFGGGVAQGIGADFNAFRGAVGSRQFQRFEPNFDFSAYELFNFANRYMHETLLSGVDRQGLTHFGAGAKLTMPLPFEEWWLTLRGDWVYQLNGDNIDALKAQGQNTGELLMGIGVEWRPE